MIYSCAPPAKGIYPTSAGLETLKLIRSYLDQTLHFEADLLSVGGAETGLVKLACYSTAAPSFLPPVLKSITTRFPNLSLSMLEGHMEMIINCLDSGEADLVFTYEQSVDHRHTFHALFAAPPYALIATGDPVIAANRSDTRPACEPPHGFIGFALLAGLFHQPIRRYARRTNCGAFNAVI